MRNSANRSTSASAQHLWRLIEPYHAIVYFAPEHRRACDELGLRGGWMAYFASRSSPLGAASSQLVTALFYNFHPDMVARAVPDAWSYAQPRAVLETRYSSVNAALRRILEDGVTQTATAADLARHVVEGIDLAGRPMAAANAALDWPDTPHLALWHAATLLREHRGGGHVATLAYEGIDGCQAHVLQVAAGRNSRVAIQTYRGWSDDDWDMATSELTERGLLKTPEQLSPNGHALYRHVEDRTDELAAAPLADSGRVAEQLIAAMRPWTGAVLSAGEIPYPNPMGVPAPDAS